MNFIWGLKKYRLILLFVSLVLTTSTCFSQKIVTEINKKVYNEKLQSIDLDSLINQVNSVALISHASCVGCVEYLLKQGICRNFIYLIDDLSITEMNQLKLRTSDPNCHFYFAVFNVENIIQPLEKSPILIYKAHDTLFVFSYDELNKLTNSFTIKRAKVKKELKAQITK